VRFPPLRGYGLVTIDPAIVYGAVDSFFGGQGGGDIELSAQRGFTPTEERIIQILVDVIFTNLRDAWAPVYNLSPEYVSREINPSFAQVGEERETVVVSRFELEVGPQMRGQLTIMYPFSALKPIRLLLRGRIQAGERDEKLAARWADQLQEAVSDAELEIVGQLGTLRMSAADLASLRVGETIPFKPSELVKVLVQSTHLFDAEYGSSDGMAAIRRVENMQGPALERQATSESIASNKGVGNEGGTVRRKLGAAELGARQTKTPGVNVA
jgi:flagellar motor switch protein FliM